jgi:hypothetical protein
MRSRTGDRDWHEPGAAAGPEEDACGDGAGHGGIGGFLRSLLAGIPWSERVEVLETLALPAPRSGALRIGNANGRIRVLGEERDGIEVRMQKVARAESEAAARDMASEIRLARSDTDFGTELEVEVPRRWNRRGHVNLEVRVPRGTRLEVNASNGRVCINAVCGGVRVRSSNVAVRVEDIEGDVEIQASNAKVHCSGIHGRLVARTSNGKIEIERHRGGLDASSSNGLIHAHLDEVSAAVVLATSNGRIALDLPEQVDADVDLRVDNGVIRNQRSLERCSRSSGGRLSGTLGRGGPPVKLRTSNGSISVR